MLRIFTTQHYILVKNCTWLFLALALLVLPIKKGFSQTDTEFWFVVPEITIDHPQSPSAQYPGSVPASFKFATSNLPATVTISMPAGDPAIFPDIVVNIPPNTLQAVSMNCWIVSPCSPIGGASFDVNRLENKRLNATGINNFGIYITSTAPITAYYEVDNHWNKDIWALKGKNGLGTEFYTPFQNQGINGNYTPTQPYSAIDVVATEDGTVVEFLLPPGISASFGTSGVNYPGNSIITRPLNRGQTFSLFPRWRTDLAPNRVSQAAADRLRGVRIRSLTGAPIAVSVKDDSQAHTSGSCRDVAGDQLIPTDIISLEYIAIRTSLDNQDNIYILATEDNTQVTIYDQANNVVTSTVLNARIQLHQPLPVGQPYYRVVADKPVYVWHVGGFGCEVGGAVLPPIDKCTGVPRVSFARTSDQTFYIIMMVRKLAENGFLFNGVQRNDLFPPATFIPVPDSDWSVARFGPFTTAQIPVGSHTMSNTDDIFHLGIVNGGSSTGCFYGYFSDYNEFAPSTLVVETGTSGGRVCVGESLQLYVNGGTSYLWDDPNNWLDDPISATPTIPYVYQSATFPVYISGACGLDTTITVSIQAAGPVDALFEPNVFEGCAKPPPGGGIPRYTFTFTSTSTGDFSREWRYRLGPTGPISTFATGNNTSADPAEVVTLSLQNDTDQPLDYYITLICGSSPPFCFREHTEIVRVYPYINVESRADIYNGCQPLDINFEATPIGNFTGASFQWDFGNGVASNDQDPSYTYYDPSPLGWVVQNYYPRATITDQWGVCSAKDLILVTVQPYIHAGFFISDTLGCAPIDVNVVNSSLGGISSYNWNITANPPAYIVDPVPPTADPFLRQLENTTAAPIDYNFRLTVANSYGCQEVLEKNVRVNPQIDVTLAPPGNTVICDSTVIPFTSTIYNPALPNVGYSWTFGDGGQSLNPTHNKLYRNFGNVPVTYPVTLTGVTEFGCIDTDVATVEVFPRITAKFSLNKPVICSGDIIEFRYDRMGSITNYTFQFIGYGDQTWPGDAFANGVFTKQFINETGSPLTVRVRLTVENGNTGCTKIIDKEITINPRVSAGFTQNVGTNTIGCNPLDVTFNNSTIFTGGTPFNGTYHWDFGDGASSLATSPSHTFINDNPSSTATFTVTLTATSVHGCISVITQNVVVQPRLEALFTMDPGSVCSPMDVTFSPSSVGATRWLWDFDGIVDNEERFNNDPFTHSFTSSDPNSTEVRPITLTVENALGCTDTYSLNVTLYPLVISTFTASEVIGCSDLEVTFTNTSTGGGVMFDWDFDNGQSFTTSSKDPFTHTFSNRASTDKEFNVRLLAMNASGCTSEQFITITVHPKVEADFSFTSDSVCTPFYATFENGSLNGNKFLWDFDHMGQTLITKNKDPFTQLFDNDTDNSILSYTISMVALDSITGCTDNTTRIIQVYPRVVATFDADIYMGCNPLEVQFSNNSTGLGTYLWEFDDGTSSTTNEPFKQFSHPDRENSRVFNVRLTSTNANGCTDVDDQVITVYPLVEANFTISDFEGCTPLIVQVNNTTISSVYTYDWNFGDGQVFSISQPGSVTIVNNLNPLAIFSPTISLTTRYSGDPSCMASQSRQVTVYPHIYPDFSGILEGCHPFTVNFENETNAFGGVAAQTYIWDFDNGAFSNAIEPTETFINTSYTDDKVYSVWLKSTSVHGCIDSISYDVTVHPKPRARIELLEDNISCSPFEVEFVNISEGVNLTYFYEFGDGAEAETVSSDPMVHTFINLTDEIQPYMTVLTAETEFGCTHQFFQTLWVYPQVKAEFYFDPASEFCNPADVTMVNQSVNTWYYTWDFDDGSTSYLQNPTHTFLNYTTDTEVFWVTLTANSIYDCEDQFTLPLTVYSQPIADFSITPPIQIYPDAEFLFTNQTRPASPDWSYSWDFGDDKPNNLQMHPGSYTYETWGPSPDFQYFVTLRVVNEQCADEITHVLTLLPAPPEALFEANYYASCPPLKVQFINASSYGDSYLWDFGDGSTSTEESPNHTFYEEGYYNVSLTVSGDGGQKTFFDVLRVYGLPKANFEVLPPIVVLPDGYASFYNLSEGASAYLWDFGDGTLSTDINPVHYYTDLGRYKVQLIAYTEYSCTDTLTREAGVIVEGAGKLRFPNAFVPDKTGPNGGRYLPVDFSNTIFHPVHEGVIEYRLMIFNRWGEQIFQSDDVWVGWDGYFNGKLAAQDVYVWRAVGKFSNGRSFDMRGNVTLLR